jgi:hypothetical protein
MKKKLGVDRGKERIGTNNKEHVLYENILE